MSRRLGATRAVRLMLAAGLAVGAAVGVAGCGPPAAPTSQASDTSGPPATAGAPGPVAAGQDWVHVHNLTLDGDRLLLGTHEGLWEQSPGQPARRLSEAPFDVMGFALAGQRMLASGHPGEGQHLPADLGLRGSTDGGSTWTGISLQGEVDFHRLRAAGDVVLGLSAHDGRLLRSSDGGRTWNALGNPPLFDLALDPAHPNRLVGTTEHGPVASDDGGSSFAPITDAPLLALLAWTPGSLYGVAPDGALHRSTDHGATWKEAGRVQGPPAALAADGDTVVVLAGDTIVESRDRRVTFAARIVGLAGTG